MNIIFQGKENIYLQIAAYYKKYIDLNIIKVGEKLPTCRGLAEELGINPNTVVKAYSILEDEGYIQTLPKKGVYVIKETSSTTLLDNVKKDIINFKNQNISYDELIDIINEVYERSNL